MTFPEKQFSIGNKYVPSAATNNKITRELMDAAYGFRQTEGAYTNNLEDDVFEYSDRL